MSKIAGALAVLGVVAGIGGAALPLSTYADAGDTKSETSAVTVKVNVNNSLAIAINETEIDFGNMNAKSGLVEKEATITVSGDVNYDLSVRSVNGNGALNLIGEPAGDEVTSIPYSATALTTATGWTMHYGDKYINLSTGGEITSGVLDGVGAPDSIDTLVTFGLLIGTNGEEGKSLAEGTYQNQVIFTAIEGEGTD